MDTGFSVSHRRNQRRGGPLHLSLGQRWGGAMRTVADLPLRCGWSRCLFSGGVLQPRPQLLKSSQSCLVAGWPSRDRHCNGECPVSPWWRCHAPVSVNLPHSSTSWNWDRTVCAFVSDVMEHNVLGFIRAVARVRTPLLLKDT